MDKVQQELSAAVKSNFALLGLDIANPIVSCNCTITPGKDGSKPPASAFTAAKTTLVPAVASQFLPGVTSLSGDIPLNAIDPGNAPFLFPTGVTPETIVAKQQADATAAQKVAQDAATLAAQKLSPTPVTVTVSAPSLAIKTTATSSTTPSGSVVPVVTTGPLTPVVGANTISTVVAASDASLSAVAPSQPAAVIETFVGPDVPSHTISLQQEKEKGGYGLCGQLSGSQFTVVLLIAVIGWYLVVHRPRQ